MSKLQTCLIYILGAVVLMCSYVANATETVAFNVYPVTEYVSEPVKKVRPIPEEQWTDTTKLWLARSCVGEAWFNTVDECMAIAWVYATRARQQNVSLNRMVRRYSSPLKRDKNNGRIWIFHLALNGQRPKHWPRNLNWKKHQEKWFTLLAALDRWAEGDVPNPVPGANHFGGSMDVPDIRWAKLKVPKGFKNRFYRSTGFGPQ